MLKYKTEGRKLHSESTTQYVTYIEFIIDEKSMKYARKQREIQHKKRIFSKYK